MNLFESIFFFLTLVSFDSRLFVRLSRYSSSFAFSYFWLNVKLPVKNINEQIEGIIQIYMFFWIDQWRGSLLQLLPWQAKLQGLSKQVIKCKPFIFHYKLSKTIQPSEFWNQFVLTFKKISPFRVSRQYI